MAKPKPAPKRPPASPAAMAVFGGIAGLATVLLVWFALRAGREPAAPAPPAPAPAAQAAAPEPHDHPEFTHEQIAAAPRMDVAELNARIAGGDVAVIDVRDIDSYVVSHIPGSLHIPLEYIAGEVPYLPRGKTLVTYCT